MLCLKRELLNKLLENPMMEATEPVMESLQYLTRTEDEVPQNSDVVLMLSQYVAAMDQFHDTYYGWTGSENDWFL